MKFSYALLLAFLLVADADLSSTYGSNGQVPLKAPKQANLRNAEKCGFYGLKNGQVLSIKSSNFNKLTANNEECSWRVLGHRCQLKTSCPCFDVPETEGCGSDYLKISDTSSFSHTFCGESVPAGVYNSTSNIISISYRLDGRDLTNGFMCYVTCTGKGQRDPPALRSTADSCRV